ncbi:GRAM domain-containing protein [Trichonephila clavipes]|nr:GRAM domain-containing protein [Trichonephila clavipes]
MPNSVPVSAPTTPPSPLPHSRLARSHNRRFHVRFPGVDSEEHLLDYYSCALVADILLQGHLYITENYFAFYSNIFGRKTQKTSEKNSHRGSDRGSRFHVLKTKLAA